MKNKNEPKTGLLAFSKANSIQYHFIEVLRCIFLVFKLKNSSQKPLKDKLQILHLTPPGHLVSPLVYRGP